MNLLPWHQGVWARLMDARSRMPHALLLQGRIGDGKLEFAEHLAQSLLCDAPTDRHLACGKCQSCNWFASENHPDFRRVEPEEGDGSGDEDAAVPAKAGKKTQIAVDQIRDLSEFLGLSSHRAGLRIVLLHPAEALNQASANALLKMLEEPPPGVLFLLISHQPQRLLPTIRSRCSKIDMPMPQPQEAQAWLVGQGVGDAEARLAYSGGAPLLAMDMDAGDQRRLAELQSLLGQGGRMDAFAAATAFAREGVADVINAMQKWIYDLLALRLTQQARYHVTVPKSLQDLANTVDLAKLLDFQRRLDEARKLALHPLNAELQLESLMIQYTQLFSKRPTS